MATFERLSLAPQEWGKTLESFPDRNIFQTPAWLAFLVETQRAEPVHAVLQEGGEVLGYFTGLTVKKLGLKILASPFRGWSTPYMGFNLRPSVPRRAALEALPDFAFRQLRCIHFEVVDHDATARDIPDPGFAQALQPTIEVDLTQSEDDLFKNMNSVCRRNIRKAEKSGVVIEVAQDPEFAGEYAAQLKDVFAKQGLVPHYGVERVRALVKHLQPAGSLLLLRARDSAGRCIATGIYPALNQRAYYWGGASWREHQILRPNELLHWHAMKYWKQRGISIYNLVGNMDFKQKFGGRETAVPMVSQSRNRLISTLRSTAPGIARTCLRLAWRLKSVVGAKSKRDSTEMAE